MDSNSTAWPPIDGRLNLPPPFNLSWVTRDAFSAARAAAIADGEAGTLVLGEDDAGLELAVVLEPDRPAAECFAVLPIAMLAMAEALAGMASAVAPLGFVWPSGLVLDGAVVGRARFGLPKPGPERLPPWLVIGLELRLSDVAGCADVAAVAFARRFLDRVQGWQTEGLAAAATAYQARLVEPASEAVRIDPLTFDLIHLGPSGEREGLAERLLLGGAGPALR